MIRLQRPSEPSEYGAIDEASLVAEFKANKTAVWNKVWLKKALGDYSHNKCAYCEDSLAQPSVFMEVEHFRPKEKYPNEVLKWTNLLPACKRCNSRKSDHDVVSAPVIDPADDEPKLHLRLRSYRFEHQTPKGKETIDVLGFHLDLKLMTDRFQIGTKASNDLETLAARISDPTAPHDTRLTETIRRRFAALLERGQRSEKYSATVATVLLADTNFGHIKTFLQTAGQWSPTLAQLEHDLREICLL